MTSCIVTCLNCLGDEGCNINIQLMCKSEIDSHQYAIVFQITMFLEGKKEMFLFYNALNTFYFRLYGMGHMVKDHSDSERGNPLSPHRLLFPIINKGSFTLPSHRQDDTYHDLCYTSRGALAGTRNSLMGPP